VGRAPVPGRAVKKKGGSFLSITNCDRMQASAFAGTPGSSYVLRSTGKFRDLIWHSRSIYGEEKGQKFLLGGVWEESYRIARPVSSDLVTELLGTAGGQG